MCHLTGKTEPVAPSEDECKAIVGEPAPDFELESDLGGKVKLSDLKGKKVVLFFIRRTILPAAQCRPSTFKQL